MYHAAQELEEVRSEAELSMHRPMKMHPTMFAWSTRSSVKGDPESATCVKLCEHIVQDGFLTSGEELWVAPMQGLEPEFHTLKSAFRNSSHESSIAPFSIGYLKGSARMNTLLVIMTFFIDDHVPVREVQQHLAEVACELLLLQMLLLM